MIILKTEYPYVERNGFANYKMIKYYAEDEKGCRYKVENQQTHKILDEAICLYPCNFTYKALEQKCEKQPSILLEDEKTLSDRKRPNKKETKIEKIETAVEVKGSSTPMEERFEVEGSVSPDDVIVEKEAAIEELTEIEDVVEELGEENKDEEGEQNNELYKED